MGGRSSLELGKPAGRGLKCVIGERIGRLPSRLLEALKVARVAGENFTAEVIARIQGLMSAR